MAACGEEKSVNMHSVTDNSKKSSGLEQNQSSSKTQLLRTKEMEKFNSHYLRRPFESLSNINAFDRVSEKKRPSTQQVLKSSSFTDTAEWQRNNTTSTTSGFNAPLAKRFAADNNSSPKPLSGNGVSLFRSSSTPVFRNADTTTSVHSSDKKLQNPSSFLRNTSGRDSPLQDFAQCNNLRSSNSHSSVKRMEPLTKVSTPYNSISNFASNKEISGFYTPSACAGFNALHNSRVTDSSSTCLAWQQKGSLRCSPTANNQMRGFPFHVGNTSSSLPNQTERPSSNGVFTKNSNEPRTPEASLMLRQSIGAGPRTPQVNQAVTPIVNRSHVRTPSGSKTPMARKFPGPAGLLPKLVCKLMS